MYVFLCVRVFVCVRVLVRWLLRPAGCISVHHHHHLHYHAISLLHPITSITRAVRHADWLLLDIKAAPSVREDQSACEVWYIGRVRVRYSQQRTDYSWIRTNQLVSGCTGGRAAPWRLVSTTTYLTATGPFNYYVLTVLTVQQWCTQDQSRSTPKPSSKNQHIMPTNIACICRPMYVCIFNST